MSTQAAGQASVALLMGSASDWATVRDAFDTLKKFGVPAEVRVLSAHRTPDDAAEFARGAAGRGIKVILAAAGGAAHLAGVLAAHSTLPVIGIPVQGGALNGMDALLATVQMPSGIPVATVAVGRAGPTNAALLAVEILALSDATLQGRLAHHKAALRQGVIESDAKLRAEIGQP